MNIEPYFGIIITVLRNLFGSPALLEFISLSWNFFPQAYTFHLSVVVDIVAIQCWNALSAL